MRPARASAVRRLAVRERQILAAAYELSEEQVEQDLARVVAWSEWPEALAAWLERQHAWHPSVPPYYLADLQAALRRRGPKREASPMR